MNGEAPADPGAAWRLQGGLWVGSGVRKDGVRPGIQTIEYRKLPGRPALPRETVTVEAGRTLRLVRSYPGVQAGFTGVGVKVWPAEARVEGAAWRLDGGRYREYHRGLGTVQKVTPGEHTISFRPVADWTTPETLVVQVESGTIRNFEMVYTLDHPVRFFLDPQLMQGLSSSELEYRLQQYVDDINAIFSKSTNRRFVFDPMTGIVISPDRPFIGPATPPLPRRGFQMWISALLTDRPEFGSYGGFGGLDASGAGGANGLFWDAIHDPGALAPDSEAAKQYWTQINNLVHEFCHSFGCGLGEFYSMATVHDTTGQAPIQDVSILNVPNDPFWNAHVQWWGDPMVGTLWGQPRYGSPRNLNQVRQLIRFSDVNSAMINGGYRSWLYEFENYNPDLRRIKVRVVDEASGARLNSAWVNVWNVDTRPPYENSQLSVERVQPGIYEFDWFELERYPLTGSDSLAKLIKAYAPGYEGGALWVTSFDAQAVRLIEGKLEWIIEIPLIGE